MAHHRLHTPYDRTTGQKIFAYVVNCTVLCYAVLGSPATYVVAVLGAAVLIATGN